MHYTKQDCCSVCPITATVNARLEVLQYYAYRLRAKYEVRLHSILSFIVFVTQRRVDPLGTFQPCDKYSYELIKC
jgi:hypothetical protein